MAALGQGRFVERLQFFDGQRLFASDLQQLEAFHRAMRELHNASLHQPGIGAGLAVTGSPGDREVVVGPGYALDLDGHEITLTSNRAEPIPPVEGDPDGTPAAYDLAVSYPSDDLLEVAETREGICVSRGAVRLREEPVFCWVRLRDDGSDVLRPADPRLRDDIAAARRILLARAEVQHCQLVSLSIAERRNARPLTQPLITCGRAAPIWQASLEPPDPDEARIQLLILEAKVSTATAGFVNTPCYSARIDGPRLLTATVDGESREFFAEGVLSIRDAAPDRFAASVLVLPFFSFGVAELENPSDVFSAWKIEWMAVD
jgi:hypothetical protein